MITIGPHTKIEELLQSYPFLLDSVAEYDPRFAKLKNPLMRKTIGRIATLSHAASVAGIELAPLLEKIAELIEHETRERVTIDLPSSTPEQNPERKDRMERLKEIIREVHAGGNPVELTHRFAHVIRGINPTEIAEMEKQLIAEGLPEGEITRLCDLHAGVFRQALAAQEAKHTPEGHPIDTMHKENEALRQVVSDLRKLSNDIGSPPSSEKFEAARNAFETALDKLAEVEKHYLRKEYQLFPVLERYGVEAPPKVMWEVHDQIRAILREVRQAFDQKDLNLFSTKLPELLNSVDEMFYKEEQILLPMCYDLFSEKDWYEIDHGSSEFGYTLIAPSSEWAQAHRPAEEEPPVSGSNQDGVEVETGTLTIDQLRLLLSHLPFDMTFVDANDQVRFYSEGDRVFPRSPEVIGRKVDNCHPPKSVHVVRQIIEAFRSGERDVAEFWIELQGRFIHIRYFAVRGKNRSYQGVLEVVQDVTGVRKLEGQRRLLEWE